MHYLFCSASKFLSLQFCIQFIFKREYKYFSASSFEHWLLRLFHMSNHFFYSTMSFKIGVNRFHKLDHIVFLQSGYILHNFLCNLYIWLVYIIYLGWFTFYTILLTTYFYLPSSHFSFSILYSAEFGDYIIYLIFIFHSVKPDSLG